MIDPSRHIRKAFFDKINETLLVDYPSVKVFDNVLLAKDHTPRIILGNQSYIEDMTKHDFGGNANIDIDITDSYEIGTGGTLKIDNIADKITEAVLPEKGIVALSPSMFKVILAQCQIIPFPTIASPTAGKYLARKILRFELLIIEN